MNEQVDDQSGNKDDDYQLAAEEADAVSEEGQIEEAEPVVDVSPVEDVEVADSDANPVESSIQPEIPVILAPLPHL